MIPFSVPSDAIDPTLRINVSVLGGSENDIDLYVKTGNGDLIYRDRLSGYTYRTIRLPSSGPYSLVFSNNFSIISVKQVWGKVQIRYNQPVVKPELLSITGLVIYVIGLLIVIFYKYKKDPSVDQASANLINNWVVDNTKLHSVKWDTTRLRWVACYWRAGNLRGGYVLEFYCRGSWKRYVTHDLMVSATIL